MSQDKPISIAPQDVKISASTLAALGHLPEGNGLIFNVVPVVINPDPVTPVKHTTHAHGHDAHGHGGHGLGQGNIHRQHSGKPHGPASKTGFVHR